MTMSPLSRTSTFSPASTISWLSDASSTEIREMNGLSFQSSTFWRWSGETPVLNALRKWRVDAVKAGAPASTQDARTSPQLLRLRFSNIFPDHVTLKRDAAIRSETSSAIGRSAFPAR
jgi:hypothetical protein